MILAAGRGERLRPLTDTVPKPLLRVRGMPLIERHVRALVRAGCTRLIINLAWLGHKIREHLGDGERFGAQILYSEESPQALETAGGIVRALPLLTPGPFAVVNGDIFTDYPFDQLCIGPAHDASLVLVPNPPQHPTGDFALRDGLARAQGSPQFTFAGIAVYRTRLFASLPDGPRRLKPELVRSMNESRCAGELYRGFWADVGTKERLAALNEGSAGAS
jgi:MurNAc alpha-1-phosphate uridylyltransferase